MFKDKLRQLRKERNISQATLAKALGVTTVTIGNYETGARQPRNKDMWNKIADYFGISVEELKDENNSHVLPTKSSDLVPFIESVCRVRDNEKIIFEGIDISDFVYNKNSEIPKTMDFAFISFQVQLEHALFARHKFIKALHLLQERPVDVINNDFKHFQRILTNEVFYWYTRIWNNLKFKKFFPNGVNNLADLYDLIMVCRRLDDMATRDYYLVELELDYDWLRDKLRDI